MEVEASGGEDGVDFVALEMVKVVAAQTVLGFDVADDGFDGGAAFHFAFNGFRDALGLARDPDFELVWIVVAFVAFVDMASVETDADCAGAILDASP